MQKFVFTFFFFCVIVFVGCSSVQEGKTLFEGKCGECHPLEDALTITKNLAEWEKTAKAMIRYSDGVITEKDAKKIVKYLVSRNNK